MRRAIGPVTAHGAFTSLVQRVFPGASTAVTTRHDGTKYRARCTLMAVVFSEGLPCVTSPAAEESAWGVAYDTVLSAPGRYLAPALPGEDSAESDVEAFVQRRGAPPGIVSFTVTTIDGVFFVATCHVLGMDHAGMPRTTPDSAKSSAAGVALLDTEVRPERYIFTAPNDSIPEARGTLQSIFERHDAMGALGRTYFTWDTDCGPLGFVTTVTIQTSRNVYVHTGAPMEKKKEAECNAASVALTSVENFPESYGLPCARTRGNE